MKIENGKITEATTAPEYIRTMEDSGCKVRRGGDGSV